MSLIRMFHLYSTGDVLPLASGFAAIFNTLHATLTPCRWTRSDSQRTTWSTSREPGKRPIRPNSPQQVAKTGRVSGKRETTDVHGDCLMIE